MRLPLESSTESVAVWTTTPWTLPANVALAVAPSGRYVLVGTADGDTWVAEARLDQVPAAGEVLRAALGAELAGRGYVPPLEGLPAGANVIHRIVAWDEVSMEEGTGVVHIAPGCGGDDLELSRGLDLPVLAPIDEEGRYVAGYGWLTGRHVTDIDGDAARALQACGRLLSAGQITHRDPTCWRCPTPLVHRVVDEWFIRCDDVRQPMRQAASRVTWRPEHYGRRMDDWLANMGDWCISRKRYWGLPLPFYWCPGGHLTVVSSKEDLLARAAAGPDELRELHRPWIDAVRIACGSCGAEASRVSEVGDCWLDAGIVAFSTLGWRNPTARPGGYADGAGEGLSAADLPGHGCWEAWFPAEVVCEMHGQVRLWFYPLLFMSVALDGRAPDRRVLTYGRVNDEAGREMHKSWGNAIWFGDAVDDLGADTMRWLYCSQPPPRDLNFGYGPGREAARRFLPLWNAYAFFVTYANLDGFLPRADLLASGPDQQATEPAGRWLRAQVVLLPRSDTFAKTELQPDFSRLGPKFRQHASRIAELLRSGVYETKESGHRVDGFLVARDDVRVTVRPKPGFTVSSGHGWVVALDTELTEELVLEGRARDLVRRIQQARKHQNLAVTDRIVVTIPSIDAKVVDAFGSWIQEQTLAVNLDAGDELTVRKATT